MSTQATITRITTTARRHTIIQQQLTGITLSQVITITRRGRRTRASQVDTRSR
jgi:hypothetical protein